MNRLVMATAAGAAAVSAALAFAGSAIADPEDAAAEEDGTASQAPNAAQELARLQAEGKSVQVVGNEGGMLENCDVANMTEGEQANTVMLEVSCGLNYP